MLILFLRHAEAEGDSEDDFSRKLTGKGKDQASRVGEFCVKAQLVPGLILTSPVLRALQTAQRVADKIGRVPVVEAGWLACGMAPETCLSKLSELPASSVKNPLMLVGHEPDFSETIAALLGCKSCEALHVRKACLAGLEVQAWRRGGAVLEFFVPARLMFA